MVPLNITGPSYQSRSVPLSAQKTLMLYPERNPGGLSEFSLISWPGLKGFSTGTGVDRGLHVMGNTTYKVTDTTLYEIGIDGTQTSRGTISDDGRCGFANDGTTMIIVTGKRAYSYTGTTLTELTAFTFVANAVTYINNQFVFGGADGNFYVTDPGTTTVNALNTGSGESNPDSLATPYAFNQLLYLVSSHSIEPWDNTGSGNPPFARIDGAIIEGVGTSSPHGVTNTQRAMYMIGVDGIPYRISGYQAFPITTPAVSKAFQEYTIDKTYATTLTFDGQVFVVFQFPEATWAYNETVTDAGEWFELGSYTGTSYVRAYSKHLWASEGNVLELDFDTYQDNGSTLSRERTFAVIAGEQFGTPRQRLEMRKLRLSLETGVGNATEEDPQIMIQPSYDGGRTWGQESFLNVGREGEFETDVEWHNIHQFKQLVIRLRMTDPVAWNLYSASIELREAGY